MKPAVITHATRRTFGHEMKSLNSRFIQETERFPISVLLFPGRWKVSSEHPLLPLKRYVIAANRVLNAISDWESFSLIHSMVAWDHQWDATSVCNTRFSRLGRLMETVNEATLFGQSFAASSRAAEQRKHRSSFNLRQGIQSTDEESFF